MVLFMGMILLIPILQVNFESIKSEKIIFLGLRDAVVEFCRRYGLPLQLSGESPPNRNYIIRKKQVDRYSRFTVPKYPLPYPQVGWE